MMRGNGHIDFDRMHARHGGANDMHQWDVSTVAELVMHLALLALFIWAVAVIVKALVRYLNAKAGITTEHAEEIAKKRYASGDITKVEYEQLKKDLK